MTTFKDTSARRRGAVTSGLAAVAASGLLAASLGMAPLANAWCANIGGLALGSGCKATFGSIAIVLGPDESTAQAGVEDEFSPFNIAISIGSNTQSAAGYVPSDLLNGLPNIANIAFATAGSTALSSGLLNLAASLGGTDSVLTGVGVANNVWNLGSQNTVIAQGFVNHASAVFGDRNVVYSANDGEGLQGLLSGFNAAFSQFGSDNYVLSGLAAGGNGPFSIAGAIAVDLQQGADALLNTNTGIELRTPFNVQTAAATFAKASQSSSANLGVNLGVNLDKASKQLSRSLDNGGKQLSGSLDKAGKQLRGSLDNAGKQLKASVKKVTKQIAGDD